MLRGLFNCATSSRLVVVGLFKNHNGHGHNNPFIKMKVKRMLSTNIFEGLGVSHLAIQKLDDSKLYDVGAIVIMGSEKLEGILEISAIESAIILSWAQEKKKDMEKLKNAKEKEREKEEMRKERENRKALKIVKTIYVFHDGKALECSIGDETEFDRLMSIFNALKEVDLSQHEPVNNKVILSWEQLQDSKLYLPLMSVKMDVQTLKEEIMNLAKSKAEFSAKKHIQEHWQLHSIHDVDYVGSDIQLKVGNGDVMGDVDTLYRIRSRHMFVLMERKTTVGVNTTASLEKQVLAVCMYVSYTYDLKCP